MIPHNLCLHFKLYSFYCGIGQNQVFPSPQSHRIELKFTHGHWDVSVSQFLISVPRHLLTEFGTYHRLESCSSKVSAAKKMMHSSSMHSKWSYWRVPVVRRFSSSSSDVTIYHLFWGYCLKSDTCKQLVVCGVSLSTHNTAQTLHSITNAKVSQHRFWHWHENRLIKTIQMILNNLFGSASQASLYYGLG